MHDDEDRILHIASSVYGQICVATQTYTKIGANKPIAVEEAIKESVDVARRMIAYARQPPSQALAVQPQVAGFPPPAASPAIGFPPPAPAPTPSSQPAPAGYVQAAVRPATPPIIPAVAFPKPSIPAQPQVSQNGTT